MDVEVLTNAERSKYSRVFESMHRQRHRVFAVGLGWAALGSDDGIEIDAFDDEAAHYLVAHDGETVYGSLRLLPAWRRSMIRECWPQAVFGAAPAFDETVWEWTRWCPGLASRPRELLAARRALILAALAFGIARGARRFVTLCDRKFIGQIEALGWKPTLFGPPMAYREGVAVAVGWTLRQRTLIETTHRLSTSRPSLIRRDARPVWAKAA